MMRSRLVVPAPLLLALLAGACDSSTEPGGPASCDDGLGVQLQVGEAVHQQGSDAGTVCVTAPGTAGEYLLMTFAGNPSSDQGISLALRAGNLVSPAAETSAVLAERRTLEGAPERATPRRDPRLDGRLRRLEASELSGRVGAGGVAPEALPPVLGQVPDPGDLDSINTQTESACQDPRYRGGVVRAVSESAIVLADTLNPDGPGTFTQEHFEHYAASFDTLVRPLAEAHFGGSSDIDDNQRTILFFTQEVNRLSEEASETFIGGFFFARDLFPKEDTPRLSACEHSNEAELLYLMVPDPQGTINGNQRDLEFIERITLTTIIHEYQHLVNSAQRLLIIESSTPFEEVWLNEGLSHVAEEVLFYHASGFAPGQNLGLDDFPSSSPERTFLNRHQIANTFRLEQFLEDPAGNSPYNEDDLLPTRGAMWHFLRYALDRRGGDQAAVLRGLVASNSGGIQNLANAFASEAEPLSTWFRDWAVALYADDRVPGIEARHRDPSWNHRSLFGGINQDSETPYRLHIRTLEDDVVRSLTLKGGGAAHYRFGVRPGETGSVEITSGGGAPPAGLRVTLLRVD